MGDAIDDMKAAQVAEKRRREASWKRRHADIAELMAAGFEAKALDKAEHHYRVKIPYYGFIDFWPSTWRWHEKKKGDERFRNAGHGLESMLARLRVLEAEPRVIVDQPGARLMFVKETTFGTTPKR